LVTVVYGARSPGELLYKSELSQWKERDDIITHITVDKGDELWNGLVGFVPNVLKQKAPSSQNAAALVCGPPIMLKFTIPVLCELGFSEESIYTSLERKMSCGIGKCGKCNVEDKYICKDGPVFTYKEISTYP
jgi:NAD(P)H-flavin reductase